MSSVGESIPLAVAAALRSRLGTVMKRAHWATAGLASTATLALSLLPAVSRPQQAGVDPVLERASGYVAAYGEKLALVRAVERYQQSVTADSRARGGRKGQSRVLVSDVLWVPSGEEVVLLLYRDVYSVDGTPVRDRGDRLLRLFPEGATDSGREKAAQILSESARFNLGTAYWNVNFPTLALAFLHPRNRRRFRFRSKGESRQQGRRAVEIEYRELVHPTLARSAAGRDYEASGALWVAREDGAIVKSEMRFESLPGRIRVSYRHEPRLGVFVPEQMHEVFGGKGTLETIEGKASYTDYRRGDAEIGPIRFR